MKEKKEIRCVHCRRFKAENEFSWSNKTKGIRNNRCKECQKDYSKAHYKKNKNDYLDTQRTYRDRNKKFICDYLEKHSCVDCGENDIIVLQFDHINPLEKDNIIAQSVTDKWCIEKLKNEIKKCEVRCANCHIKRHAKEGKTYRYVYKQTSNGDGNTICK